MSLSICCVTANPSRAAVVLPALREVADEVVVAVDVSGGAQDLTPLSAVADRLFEIELETFPEPAMAWLHAQCSTDWILRVDDDEVLAASGDERPGPPAEEIPMSSWKEIQRTWPRREFSEEAYRGEIELFERAPRLYEGQQRALTVRVTNGGTEHWPGMEREPWIKLAHRWRASNGSGAGAWRETCLPASIAPGAGALVPIAVEPQMSAGRHRLECALVHEDPLHGRMIRRFAETSIQINVQAAGREPSVAFLGDPEPVPSEDAVGAGHRSSGFCVGAFGSGPGAS